MNRYAWWRYLLIIVITVIGIVYALPNLYGEDPAIQISSKSASTLPADLITSIKKALADQKIATRSIQMAEDQNDLLIRFNDTTDQLRAQDIVQAAVGNNYSVALNLAPKTPKWLQAINAQPMRLGLDLRGGIHFLLQVDLNAMLKERSSADLHAMGKALRDQRIRYTGINSGLNGQITIRFRNDTERQKALVILRKQFSEYRFLNRTKDFAVQATLDPKALQQIEAQAVSQNITILRNRVNELGVAEPVISQQGKNKISLDLPGIQDTARAKDIIGKVATVRFQLVDTEHDAEQAANSGVIPFGSTLYRYEGRPYLLKNEVVLHGSAILNASTIMGEDGRAAVSIRAGGSGVSYFSKVTAANIGKPLAAVYVETQTEKQLVDGKVVSTPKQVERIISIATIQSALGNQFQIQGLDSMQYAQNLALLLRSGAYSAPVTFVQERLIGPSLGKENIRMGVLSCEVGSALVILFMAIYYRLFGIVANLALILNVVVLIALMSMLGFTLTLPGIAGIVLTVGMAVDANVLINERIREELRNGLSPQAAIRAGYDRAFSTIVDANVTTLIVAVILFALGTGAVQGFAVTITIGLLISMFTAIFFTRGIINLIYSGRKVKPLSIGIKV